MIWIVNRIRSTFGIATFLFAVSIQVHAVDKLQVKPMAGPRATILRETPLYVSPDTTSQKVDRIQEGREWQCRSA